MSAAADRDVGRRVSETASELGDALIRSPSSEALHPDDHEQVAGENEKAVERGE